MGFSCTISQVLLIREFMVIFSGNELTLGIVFANWLLCSAIGSWGLGRFADRLVRKTEWFVGTQILASLILPVQVLFTRYVGSWMGAEIGEVVSLLPIFYFTFLTLLPFCALHGFQFTLGCKIYSNRADTSSIQISKVYVFESLGAMIGGLLFVYLLVHYFNVLETAVWLALLNLMLALFLQVTGKTEATEVFKSRLLTGIIITLVATNMSAMVSGKISDLHVMSYRWQWKGMDVIHYENSIYGNIVITKSSRQLDFWVDGLPLFTTPDPNVESVEEVAHFPMLQHPSPERVLLIGGGVGGVLAEILKHPIREVTYVELDPLIIELAKKYSPEDAAVLDDPRVRVIYIDGRLFVKKAEGFFDVIIVNLPFPSTLQLNRFYTVEFFKEVREILVEDGVFSIGLPSSLTHISEEMRNRNKCVYAAIKEAFPSYLAVPGDFNIFMASPNSKAGVLTYNVDILYQRLLNRGLKTRLFTREYIKYKFSLELLERGLKYLDRNGEPVRINRDLSPVGVYYDLVLWNAMFYPFSRVFFSFVSQINLLWFIIPLGLLTFALVLLRGKRVSAPIFAAIVAIGFAGMTFNIVLIFAFQVLYGYLYQELGVVSAAFMLGLALGGLFMSFAISRRIKGVSALVKVESVIIAHSFLLPLSIMLLFLYASEQLLFSEIRFVFPVSNCVAGFLVGLAFPLASEVCLKDSGQVGRVVGALYASDLFGGCVGALLSGVWLIPLLGVLETCLVVAMLNVVSLVLVLVSSRKG